MSCTAASTMPPGCWFPITGTPPIEEMSTARPYVCAETRRGAFLFLLGRRLGDEAGVAADEAGDRHLAVCLGEIEKERENPGIDAS